MQYPINSKTNKCTYKIIKLVHMYIAIDNEIIFFPLTIRDKNESILYYRIRLYKYECHTRKMYFVMERK